ncbi:MAG: hypothetical protein GXO65_00870 [Euryarchaeota archaeon]|nr:hypothetical protein [Euryarchaeota archaeon]
MENERKAVIISAAIALVMLALVVPHYHRTFEFQFPGFEILFGVVGTILLALIFKGLGIVNMKEGLWDD